MTVRLKATDLATATNGQSVLDATHSEQTLTRQVAELVRRSSVSVEQAAERTYKGERYLTRTLSDGRKERYQSPAFTKYLDKLKAALKE